MARSLWYTGPGVVEMRAAALPPLSPGQALVRTLFTGISRGTERLVLSGLVGQSEWQRMRAPLQEGTFPFPVKYGYCATGIVEEGPPEMKGQTVFCLHPHQDYFIAPQTMLAPVPDTVPPRRATLAANMETALNAHWDAGTGPGDRIAVVGAGVVGLLVAHLAARLPGSEVTVYDVDASRRDIVEALGCTFVVSPPAPGGRLPAREPPGVTESPAPGGRPPAGESPGVTESPAPGGRLPAGESPGATENDVVFHASVTAAGLDLAISLAGDEATVIELSWYGDRPVTAGLGGAFHSRRLRLAASQVGQIAPSRRPRWSYARRLAAALRLLADPALDPLVSEEIGFTDAPARLPELLAHGAAGLAPVIRYPEP